MKVVFLASDEDREQKVGAAFIAGVKARGDTGQVIPSSAWVDCDVAVMVGVKSREKFRAAQNAGAQVIMLDKGYQRHRTIGRVWEYWRAAVNAHHPTGYLMARKQRHNRLYASGLELAPWRERGGHIVVAGASAKYHAFYNLADPTTYARGIVADLKWATDREIVYRPKPSWRDAVPIDGTRYSGSGEKLGELFRGAWAIVTHGSNICFEAVLAGIPCIVLGDGIAAPISSTSLADIEKPRLASEPDRRQWLANLLYCQWKMEEFASGAAWKELRRNLRDT